MDTSASLRKIIVLRSVSHFLENFVLEDSQQMITKDRTSEEELFWISVEQICPHIFRILILVIFGDFESFFKYRT